LRRPHLVDDQSVGRQRHWRLAREGTRPLLHRAGFDLTDKRGRAAFGRMSPGWHGTVLPNLAELAVQLR
jgi:hypothetical protein